MNSATSSVSNKSTGDRTAQERILVAAARLMTIKSPSQITGRELAREADVNYGLIHHYFGGKDLACRKAFRRLAGQYVEGAQADEKQDWILHLGRLPEYADLWRILAHAAMDSESLEILGWDYPLLRARLTDHRSKRDGADTTTSKENIAEAFCLALGWTVFQPFIKEALGLTEAKATRIGENILARIDELW